jgi:hypothetical protein
MRWFASNDGVDRRFKRQSSRLISDTEAFLTGTIVGRLVQQNAQVPAWAWLNKVAHGELQNLHAVGHIVRSPTSDPLADLTGQSWGTAQGMLARDVIELVGDDPSLLWLVQRSVLVPLELRLMHHDRLTAYELVELTRAALRLNIP